MQHQVQQESCEEAFFSENFSLRRGALQRSRDSGALTDWSSDSHSPTWRSCKSYDSISDDDNYVTVVSVNDGVDQCVHDLDELSTGTAEFITILRIGEEQEAINANGAICLCIGQDSVNHLVLGSAQCPFVDDITYVDRLPGERLGFGLKFDGGLEKNTKVNRLFIQCCAEHTPASRVRCSWGAIMEADELVQIQGEKISSLTRSDIVSKLTQGSGPLQLLVRHWVDETERLNIVHTFLHNTGQKVHRPKSKASRKTSAPQERAIDVPAEYLKPEQACDIPPPVPPRRKKRARLSNVTHPSKPETSSMNSLVHSSGVPCKPPRTKHALLRRLAGKHSKASTCTAAVLESLETCPSKSYMNNTSSETIQHEQHLDNNSTQLLHSNDRLLKGAKSIDVQQDRSEEVSVGHLIIPPPPPEIYVNLIAEEDRRIQSLLESESESDTNSSISTVIDCWSLLSHTVPPSPIQPCSRTPFALDVTITDDLEGTDFLREILRENASFMDGLWRVSKSKFQAEEHSSKDHIAPSSEQFVDDISRVVIEPPASFSDVDGAIVAELKAAPSSREVEKQVEAADQATALTGYVSASSSPGASGTPSAEPSGGIKAKTALNGSLLKGLTHSEGGEEEKPEQHSVPATVACLERPRSNSPHHPGTTAKSPTSQIPRLRTAKRPSTAKSVGIVRPIPKRSADCLSKSSDIAMEFSNGSSNLLPEVRRLSQSLRDVNSRSLPTWRRDEPSEKSVRDKIALFTNETDSKAPVSNKQNSRSILSPSKTINTTSVPILGAGLKPLTNKNSGYIKTAANQTGLNKSAPNSNLPNSIRYSSTEQLKPDSTADNLRAATRKPADSLAERSKSLLDVTTKSKKITLTANPQRNASVTDLAERRRKTMSRLRGLVIPDNDLKPARVVQLPKITSKDSVLLTKVNTDDLQDSITRFSESRLIFLGDSKHHVDETSDTDSAVSSGRSFSPPESPIQPAGEDPRVLKPHSIEALNRRNVLQSAKCSSGGTADSELDFTNRETSPEYKDSWKKFNHSEKVKSDQKQETQKEQNFVVRTAFINEVEFIPNYPTDASIDSYSITTECVKPANKETVFFTEKRLDMCNFETKSSEAGLIPAEGKPQPAAKPAGLNRAASDRIKIRMDLTDHAVSEPFMMTSNQLNSRRESQYKEANQNVKNPRETYEVANIQLARRSRVVLVGGIQHNINDDTSCRITPRSILEQDNKIQSDVVDNTTKLDLKKEPEVVVNSRGRPSYTKEDTTGRPNVEQKEKPEKHESERPETIITTVLVKDGTGLGFSLDGGKDSPSGDKPLTIKKIFTGGPASKNDNLRAGDEIVSMNGHSVGAMSRIEAWNFMKKLRDGVVTLVIKQKTL